MERQYERFKDVTWDSFDDFERRASLNLTLSDGTVVTLSGLNAFYAAGTPTEFVSGDDIIGPHGESPMECIINQRRLVGLSEKGILERIPQEEHKPGQVAAFKYRKHPDLLDAPVRLYEIAA